jgi:hypothetical protein
MLSASAAALLAFHPQPLILDNLVLERARTIDGKQVLVSFLSGNRSKPGTARPGLHPRQTGEVKCAAFRYNAESSHARIAFSWDGESSSRTRCPELAHIRCGVVGLSYFSCQYSQKS